MFGTIYHLTEGDLDNLRHKIRELKDGDELKIAKVDSDHLFVQIFRGV